MNNAERILRALDEELAQTVELTLYGRAAFQLGFTPAREEFAHSRDVDAVLWLGQAEELQQQTDFWQAVERVNRRLADQELFLSHFFVEDQVILRPQWRTERVPLPGKWKRIVLYRLGDLDLLLSKLMRSDPIDQADARFVVTTAQLARHVVEKAVRAARVPAIPEVREQFELSVKHLFADWPSTGCLS